MKKSFLKSVVVGVILAMLMVSLPSSVFAETSKADSNSDEVITLEFWHSREQAECQQYFQDYEKVNKNVKINQTVMLDEDYKTQSRIALASGVTPDVWWTNAAGPLETFASSGGLMDITQYQDQYGWNKRFLPSALANCMVDGKLYGLPFTGLGPWATLYMNKNFFEQNNLQYPKTIDDLCALAPVIRNLGKEPMIFYDQAGWPGALLFGDLVLQQVGAEWVDQIISGEISWAGNKVAYNAMMAEKKMADAGVFLTGFGNLTQRTALPLFLHGECPIMYNGTWFISIIGKEFDFDIETIVFPQITPGSYYHAYQNPVNWVLGVCPSSKYQKQALDFLNYATSYSYTKLASELQGEFSPIVGQNAQLDLPYYFMTEPLLVQFGDNVEWTNFFHYAFGDEVCLALKDQIKMVLEGQTTIDEALVAIDRVQKNVLANKKKK